MTDVVTPLFGTRPAGDATAHRAQVIAVTSGKGGVGKTNIATNLAISLARKGHKVCIIDADAGLANINILLGVRPEKTLEHFLDGEATLTDVMIDGPDGLQVIPGASGIAELAQLDAQRQNTLLAGVQQLERRFDFLLIDTAAGIGDNVTRFVLAADAVMLVISPDPTSLTDAFAMTRVLKRKGYTGTLNIVVNQASDAKLAQLVYQRFASAVNKYLQVGIESYGYVTADPSVSEAVRAQVPFLVADASSRASLCIERLTGKIQLLKRLENTESITARLQRLEGPAPAADETKTIHEGRPKDQLAPQTDPDSLATGLLAAINNHDYSEVALRATMESLIGAYLQRFAHYPLDMREAQFRQLESAAVTEADLREQLGRLEKVFEKRFGKALVGRDDALFRLMTEISESEPDLANALSRLQQAYDARFTAPVAPTINGFIDRLQKSEASADDIADAIESLRLMFREKFAQEYSVPDLALRQRISAVVGDVVERENARQEALLMLTAELSQHQEIQKKLDELRDYLDNH